MKTRDEKNEEKTYTFIAEQPSISKLEDNNFNFFTNEQFFIFVKKFKKFMRKNNYKVELYIHLLKGNMVLHLDRKTRKKLT